MMTQEEFNQWCVNQSLSEQALIEIEKIRNAQPSRSVGNRCKNVSGRYPSRKMGVTIQFESHKVELPFIYQLEHAEDVLEYYDQPPPFKIKYTSASGRNLGVIITPDFFVIRSHSAGWVECKAERELEKLAQKSPHRYQLDSNNKWQSPPGFYYAQQFGFDFQLWSSAKINWTLQRNLEFLEDYYKSDLSLKFDENDNIVTSLVEAYPGISLAKLLDYKGVNADNIYSLIATEKIYVDLTAHLLVEVDKFTKSVNPKNLSVWTLGLLYMYLTEWAYVIYDTTEHPALQGQLRELLVELLPIVLILSYLTLAVGIHLN